MAREKTDSEKYGQEVKGVSGELTSDRSIWNKKIITSTPIKGATVGQVSKIGRLLINVRTVTYCFDFEIFLT